MFHYPCMGFSKNGPLRNLYLDSLFLIIHELISKYLYINIYII